MIIRAGFIPLIDCAPLIVADRKGFASQEGIALDLGREASWATVRDKITIRHFDCAHLLAPMVVASNVEVGNAKAVMVSPFTLSLNGNAISVSNALFDQMVDLGLSENETDPAVMAKGLKKVIDQRRDAGQPNLRFGMVYPFSPHNYELRYWLASAGIDPDQDIDLAVIPPPFIVDYLREDQIDGFCVGAPWSEIGASANLTRTIVVKAHLWRRAPEKVLGMRAQWAEDEPEMVACLLRAIKKAALWCDAQENRAELAHILAAPDVLDQDRRMIERILRGQVQLGDGPTQTISDYVVFAKDAANFPWRSHALWFYSQMVRWGQARLSEEGISKASQSFRPDIYRRTFSGLDVDIPAANSKVEGAIDEEKPVGSTMGKLVLPKDGFFDRTVFDPDDIAGYLESFPVKAAHS